MPARESGRSSGAAAPGSPAAEPAGGGGGRPERRPGRARPATAGRAGVCAWRVEGLSSGGVESGRVYASPGHVGWRVWRRRGRGVRAGVCAWHAHSSRRLDGVYPTGRDPAWGPGPESPRWPACRSIALDPRLRAHGPPSPGPPGPAYGPWSPGPFLRPTVTRASRPTAYQATAPRPTAPPGGGLNDDGRCGCLGSAQRPSPARGRLASAAGGCVVWNRERRRNRGDHRVGDRAEP
jgi:hypothetical protein